MAYCELELRLARLASVDGVGNLQIHLCIEEIGANVTKDRDQFSPSSKFRHRYKHIQLHLTRIKPQTWNQMLISLQDHIARHVKHSHPSLQVRLLPAKVSVDSQQLTPKQHRNDKVIICQNLL
jgi:hypothetical protein